MIEVMADAARKRVPAVRDRAVARRAPRNDLGSLSLRVKRSNLGLSGVADASPAMAG
jgi:hypothetical protein